jgi:hypothetical protein
VIDPSPWRPRGRPRSLPRAFPASATTTISLTPWPFWKASRKGRGWSFLPCSPRTGALPARTRPVHKKPDLGLGSTRCTWLIPTLRSASSFSFSFSFSK